MVSGTTVIALEWSLAGASLLFVVLRLYVRFLYQSRKQNISDYLIVAAFIALVSTCACDTKLREFGLFRDMDRTYQDDITTVSNDPDKLVAMLKIVYGSALPYYTNLWLIKCALLLFYYSVVPISLPKHRLALYITSGVVGFTYLLVIFFNSFWCFPVSRNWALDNTKCFSFASLPPFFVSVASNVITDFMILCLPFPLLRGLKLPRKQIYGLIFIFCLGGICIIATIARVISLALSATVGSVAIWSTTEGAVGIMVACSPALRVLVRAKSTGNTRNVYASAVSGSNARSAPRARSRNLGSVMSGNWGRGDDVERSTSDRSWLKLTPEDSVVELTTTVGGSGRGGRAQGSAADPGGSVSLPPPPPPLPPQAYAPRKISDTPLAEGITVTSTISTSSFSNKKLPMIPVGG